MNNIDSIYFSITVELIPYSLWRIKKDEPIIQIKPEEYIIGSFNDSEKIKKKYI